LYIISVKDDAVREVAGILSAAISNVDACVVHTSGTLPLKILTSYFKNAGVLYPLQTFTKNKQIDFSSVPFFIEGTAIVLNLLQKLLNDLSHNVYFIDSNERKLLHLASVFACNFVNHDIGIAKKILCKMSVIFPLISETIEKLKQLPPNEAQTGPAVREDFKVIDEHIKLLSDFPYEKAIYINTTNNIIRYKHLK